MYMKKRPSFFSIWVLGLSVLLVSLTAHIALAQDKVSDRETARVTRQDTSVGAKLRFPGERFVSQRFPEERQGQAHKAESITVRTPEYDLTTVNGMILLGPCAGDNLCHEQDQFGYPIDCGGP